MLPATGTITYTVVRKRSKPVTTLVTVPSRPMSVRTRFDRAVPFTSKDWIYRVDVVVVLSVSLINTTTVPIVIVVEKRGAQRRTLYSKGT